MVTTGEPDGWGSMPYSRTGCTRDGIFSAGTGFARETKRNAVEAVNGLTSDDEDTVNGALGPLEQPR